MFGKGVYLSVFYCLCYVKDISTDMWEDQVSEESCLNLNEEEDIRLNEIIEYHWRYFAEEGDDKKKYNALRWEVYVKDNEELIHRECLVSVPHSKGVKIVWDCVKYDIIDEKEVYKYTGLHGFD